MTPRVTDQRTKAAPVSAAQDPFDLDVSVVESGGTVGMGAASDGGCGSSCGGNACVSSGL